MALAATVLKYVFVVSLGVEVLVILRSLVILAREKARQPSPPLEAKE